MEIEPLPESLDIRLESGLRVRDLMTVEACDLELRCIERDRDLICGQIAADEAAVERREPGWRTRAQMAMRWKKRAMKAIKAHKLTLPTATAAASEAVRKERRRLILAVIEEDIGQDAMARYVRIARHRHPDSFGGGEDVPREVPAG